jgi:predicted ATPase
MMEAVHRYEGTVNQVMGDGIMALFGAPLAHEDHAVRACYAALRMQDAVKRYAEEARRAQGVTVRIRVGLNSGEVVVRAIDSDLHMDYTAVGQTTHLAARMEQLADPGAILITPATLAQAEGYVEVRSLGPVPVKGIEGPLEVYEMRGASTVRSRFQAAAARGLTRFVGRRSEMDQLAEALDHARTGRGQVVAVVGEPGVGKSRLYYEFTHSHVVRDALVIESASVSYGKAAAYLPVIELVKGYFRIEGRDDARAIREKVTGRLLSLDRSLEPFLPAFLWLLDVAVDDKAWEHLDPRERRGRTLDGVKRVILRESQVQPVVVLFEDLHWIDAETQTLLEALVESLPTARLLLLVSYRPEYRHGWGSKTYYRQLRIDPLPAATARELLDALLGHDASVEPLKPLLVRRTEGTPLFLEESVRTLVETKMLVGARGAYRVVKPLEPLAVPASVTAMLAARIDRLTPETKAVLQAASVIGTDVSLDVLRAIAGVPEDELRRHLAHLQAAEFLYETSLFPDVEYTFKHALTHEVAYGGLLQERRRDLHGRVVAAIETLHPHRLDEHVDRLAHHARRGELRERAAHYLRLAGIKATARSATHDARMWFDQALEVLDALPESRETLEQGLDIRLQLRAVLTQLGEVRRALERLREAEALAERLNDDRGRGRVCAAMSHAQFQLGELDAADESATRALRIARALGDLELRIFATTSVVQLRYFQAEYERAVELAHDNLAALPADWIYEHFGTFIPPSVLNRYFIVLSLAALGRFADAPEHEAEAIRIAERMAHPVITGTAYFAAGERRLLQGDWAAARPAIERWIRAYTGHSVLLLPIAVAAAALASAQLGEVNEALRRLEQAEPLLEEQVARPIFSGYGLAYCWLGHAALLLGRPHDALRLADRAVATSPRHPGSRAHASLLLGAIAAHPDRVDFERGNAHYRGALALAEPRRMRPLVAHCHLGIGSLSRRTGKPQEGQEHLSIAAAMYREMDMRFWLEQAEAEMRARS